MKKSKTQVQSNRKISGDKVKRAAMKLISLAFPDLIILASFTGAVYCGAILQTPKIFRFFDQKINKLFSKGGSK